jgi:hypothetical protein
MSSVRGGGAGDRAGHLGIRAGGWPTAPTDCGLAAAPTPFAAANHVPHVAKV